MPQRPHRYVVPLSALGRPDTQVAGGKGANLGELVRAGAPVPAGFVLTTAAFAAHLRHNHLTARLPELLAASPDGSAVRAAVRSAPVPPPVADSLRHAYTDLVGERAEGAVAVRSSATTEDLPGASLAGQYRSILNVVGVPALLDAVRECWASLWSARPRRLVDWVAAHRRIDPVPTRITTVDLVAWSSERDGAQPLPVALASAPLTGTVAASTSRP